MNAAGRDFRTLSRIAALLVALALLAERAGGMAFPIRFIVLAILRRAETVAHGFLLDETQATWPYFDEDFEMDNRPVDAAWLAWRFRVLAAMLGAFMRLASGASPWHVGMCDAAGALHRAMSSRPVLAGRRYQSTRRNVTFPATCDRYIPRCAAAPCAACLVLPAATWVLPRSRGRGTMRSMVEGGSLYNRYRFW